MLIQVQLILTRWFERQSFNCIECNCNSRPRKTVKWVRFKSYRNFVLLLFKMMTDILKFTETPNIDESIEEYEYHEFDPDTGTNLHNGDDIRIIIESQDVFTHTCESYLIFKGLV